MKTDYKEFTEGLFAAHARELEQYNQAKTVEDGNIFWGVMLGLEKAAHLAGLKVTARELEAKRRE